MSDDRAEQRGPNGIGGRRARLRRSERQIAQRAALALTATIFAADLLVGPEVAAGVLYIVPVLFSLWRYDRRTTQLLALVCTGLVLVDLAVGLIPERGEPWTITALSTPAFVHHMLAIFAIAVSAHLGTIRMRIEEALVENRDMTQKTLRNIEEAVVLTDADNRVTYLNPSAERLLGWRRIEARSRPVDEVVRIEEEESGPGSPIEDLPDSVRRGRRILISRDGREVPIHESRSKLRNRRGQLRGRVLVLRDETDRKRYEDTIRQLAYRDSLTDLPNRTSLTDRLQLEIAHARRNRTGLAVLFVDLDGFKEVNDTFGHHAGDVLLRGVAEALRKSLREQDTVARIGGDEFTVLLPGVRGPVEASLVAHKILRQLATPIQFEGHELRAGGSIGIALYDTDGDTAAELLQAADAAMYAAKAAGGGRFLFHGDERSTRESPTSSRTG